MKKRKIVATLILLILILVISAITFLLVTYDKTIDIKNKAEIISVIENVDHDEEIKILKTKYEADYYVVLFSSEYGGENCYGVQIFKKHNIYKNRYITYGFDSTTNELGYYKVLESKNDVQQKRAFIVGYGLNRDSLQIIIDSTEKIHFSEPLEEGYFIELYDFYMEDDNVNINYKKNNAV